MAYTPEPTHPFDATSLPPQLNREFWALFNNDAALKDYIIGAMPHKAFNVILDGVGGADGGGPNPVVPSVFDGYNLDRTYGTDGVLRISEGLYEFRLAFAQVAGINILEVIYPTYTFSLGDLAHIDPTAEQVRYLLVDADPVAGTLQVGVQQLEVPPSGKGVWEWYDLRDSGTGSHDRAWTMATLNLQGNAGDYPDVP